MANSKLSFAHVMEELCTLDTPRLIALKRRADDLLVCRGIKLSRLQGPSDAPTYHLVKLRVNRYASWSYAESNSTGSGCGGRLVNADGRTTGFIYFGPVQEDDQIGRA